MRVNKDSYYLDIADSVSDRSTCLRSRYGAVIVRDDEIISTGYNGAPRGTINCCDRGVCKRKELNIPSGERYELCRSVHAEQNAIISGARKDMIGSTLYLSGRQPDTGKFVVDAHPCDMCKRFILNAGIQKVICRDGDSNIITYHTEDWIQDM